MTQFDRLSFSPPLARLWSVERWPELGPGRPDESARADLSALTLESAFPVVRNVNAAKACLSGLWLYHDFLNESHTISQDLDDWFGSYWHGIMHRREPDPENAKYWFRRVPTNAVFERLAERGDWDPFAFVDRCEKARATGSEDERLCRALQLHEMQFLFAECHRLAIGA
jgi:hypothetical protein